MARQMKDSGVEWIGDIPQDWSVSATKYLFNIQSGSTPDSKKEEFWDGDIRWVTPADFKTDDVYVKQGRRNISDLGFSSCSLQIIPTGSIIFSKRAPVGSVVINNTDLSINQGCLACMNKGQSDTKYYYYVMAIATEQYELHSSGTTFKEISAYTFSNFKLPHPPNDRQRVIADYIDAKASLICKVVDQTRATIEEYKKLKRAIITEAVTKGVRGARPMKPSGVEWIGDIPEEWEVRKVSQFWKANKGPNAAQLTAEYCGNHPGAYPVYSGQTENNGVMGMIDTYSFDFGARGCLFSTTVGAKAMTVSCLYNKFSLSQNCMIMQPLSEKCDVRYYFYLFAFIFGYFRSLIPDYMQPSFRVKDFLSYCMLLPSVIEQQEIATYLDAKCAEIDRIIEKKEQLIEELGSYKKSLIYEYVTGKKEVTA